ncbi:unnamed protein product [Ambrosiozyma monospora]|uniref:Unnamed protein product n=1 Tax=Ambrosiozyma monospora TaxID=43982 RepID=A0A9W7DK04_AMBMO|nr:unnamed protein product [Ambrosiozyma monospora]
MTLQYSSGRAVYLFCRSRFKCESSISVTVDEEKGLFYLRYVRPPVHGHTGAEVVEVAKQEYLNCVEFYDEHSSNADSYIEGRSSGESSSVGSKNKDTTIQALRVPGTSKLVTLRCSTDSSTARPEMQVNNVTSTTANGEDDYEYENPVKILVDDDDYVFSDHESLDHGEDEISSPEHDMYAGTTFISTAQSSMISQVTHSLLFEQDRFTNPAGSSALREDLEGFMYYAKRLYDSID